MTGSENAMKETTRNALRGGGFLLDGTASVDVFTPEDFSQEQQLIREMTQQFVEGEVVPRLEEIESRDWDLTRALLRSAAEIGLCGIEVPEKFGGAELDKVSAMIVTEQMARVGSFAVTYGGHTGIGTLPIVYFGTEDQKQKYLPALSQAEMLSSYALSEAGSGSDALAARASASRDGATGDWTLTGEKMWITNAAFADLFVTFAQVDGDKFSCFIVEKAFPGVSTGAEEQKMGLKGSSTRTLLLDRARIPGENLLGEVGKGHRVAFNILNTGRAKLGANAVGASKTALNSAIGYARVRVAFGRPIASFGAIRHKLGEMAIRTWITEAMVYRTAGLLDRALETVDTEQPAEAMKAIEEYAIECSVLKVFGTEVLDYVVDEAVQIHGGYGYSQEYDVERYYRDARVNRIFEGTNEINRMLIPTMLAKRAEAGRLPIQEATRSAMETVLSGSAAGQAPTAEKTAIIQARTAALFVAGSIMAAHRSDFREQQELLMHLSDIVIETYAMDTAAARLEKTAGDSLSIDIVHTFITDAMVRIEGSARAVLVALAGGQDLRDRLEGVHRMLRWEPTDGISSRRRIAEALSDAGRYCF